MEVGTIRTIDIDHEMRGAYLDYAMSVIVARALPDARDGLKPVHRRILYAMHDMGLAPDKPYRKSARIVGEVLGKYHPHGDSAVYDAMARMAQDFSMRYPLVDGQGNFGSIDGDAPAAMRYTEARLSTIATEMLADIDKDTVDWTDNFDGSLKEPAVLPAGLPNLLLNGTSGIAVGMATNIPPHNLNELADGIVYLLDNYERAEEIGVEELMQFVHGPDFPTGGLILGAEGIRSAYATGKGRVVLRAVTHFEELKGGRQQIVVTEIPYQVNKTALLERIAELVHAGKIDDISDLRDESDRRGMRIIIELKRTAQPRKVLNQLLKYTLLQSTFGINLLALVDNEPRTLSLKRALIVYVEHRREVVTRRTRFELEKARQRAHILEGLRIALQFLDEVIALIRGSRDAEEARQGLMARFKLSEVQAQAILDMPLRRLAALERQKIEDEYNDLLQRIRYLEDLLANPQKILGVIRDELLALKQKFGDGRRTHILHDATESLNDEDLVPQERVVVTLTQRGYIKRAPARLYRAQGRGGRGVQGITTREEDSVRYLATAYTLERMLFFTNRGRAFQERVFQIPDAGRGAKGVALANVLNLDAGEIVTAALPAPDAVNGSVETLQGRYLVMVTAQAKIKRVELAEFASIRPAGIVALSLDEGDELGWVRLTEGSDEVIIVSQGGRAIRFPDEEVRPMGRSARGVGAMRLNADDRVASMEVVEAGADLLLLTASGYGKRTALEEFPAHGRAGGGVTALGSAEKVGGIVAARVVSEQDDVIIISEGGVALRMGVAGIPRMGRSARGARLITLKGGDRAVSIARITPEPAGEGEGPAAGEEPPVEPSNGAGATL
jgi:DNA gyrase subunit A